MLTRTKAIILDNTVINVSCIRPNAAYAQQNKREHVRLNLMLFHWWFSLREVPVTASTAQVLQWIVIDDRQISRISIFLFINMNFSDIFIQTDWLASRDVVTSRDLPLISWGRPRPFWLTAKNLKAYPHIISLSPTEKKLSAIRIKGGVWNE